MYDLPVDFFPCLVFSNYIYIIYIYIYSSKNDQLRLIFVKYLGSLKKISWQFCGHNFVLHFVHVYGHLLCLSVSEMELFDTLCRLSLEMI